MQGASVFIDSTTFLYSHDGSDLAKRDRARRWLTRLTHSDTGVTNLQVLNEVTNVLIRKAYWFAAGSPFTRVDVFADFGVSPLSNEAAFAARAIQEQTRYSWWDCLLLASALELRCTHFLSEDLQDGQMIAVSLASKQSGRSLTIVDPFAHTPEQILPSR